jgi:hypothetical protein
MNTLDSVRRQNQNIHITIFHHKETVPEIKADSSYSIHAYNNDNDFQYKLARNIDETLADYYVLLNSSDRFFTGALSAVASIFGQYPEITWLTGIQTLQSKDGYDVVFGNTAIRRWNHKIYESNLYKQSVRYIPCASTFWKRELWDISKHDLYFTPQNKFCEDLWLSFFKKSNLYTTSIYLSSTCSRDFYTTPPELLRNTLVEDGLLDKIGEFFFINNVPYLRYYYKKKSGLAPVVRFDHKTQSFYLYDY